MTLQDESRKVMSYDFYFRCTRLIIKIVQRVLLQISNKKTLLLTLVINSR